MNNTVGAKTLVACQTVLPSAFVIDSAKQKPQNNNQKMFLWHNLFLCYAVILVVHVDITLVYHFS